MAYNICWVKNTSGSSKVWVSQTVENAAYYQIQETERLAWTTNDTVLTDIGSGDLTIAKDNSGSLDISGVSAQIDWLRAVTQQVSVTDLPEARPFASPDFRTKRDATPSAVSCAANASATIDFQLTSELHVAGGQILVKDGEFEDWVHAEVYDKDSVIPEAYRTALCEDWPTVASYVVREWVDVRKDSAGVSAHIINTKPLNAKISAGLYLRVTYNAANVGSTRKVLINYDLTKKL